jgi:hypothetical protein
MSQLRVTVLALAMGAVCFCGLRPYKVENREYHGLPSLTEDSHFLADSFSVARDGPYLMLRLHELGKPDFALPIFVRAYGLEHIDSTADYVFNIRIESVMQGARPAETREIKSIFKDGKRIYPR